MIMTMAAKTTKATEYEVISNCPKCKGALLPVLEAWKCFQCGRVYRIEAGQFKETFEVFTVKKWR